MHSISNSYIRIFKTLGFAIRLTNISAREKGKQELRINTKKITLDIFSTILMFNNFRSHSNKKFYTGLPDMLWKASSVKSNNVKPNNIAWKRTKIFQAKHISKLSTRPFLTRGRK